MKDALRLESVRVSTIRSTYWCGSVGLLLCGLSRLLGSTSVGLSMSAEGATLLLAAGGESLPFSVMGLAVA